MQIPQSTTRVRKTSRPGRGGRKCPKVYASAPGLTIRNGPSWNENGGF
jgi:hypothetical protein